ncbi:hypothetical protein EDD86DRAFT_245554 [Gorgonomyces haynaldii]|nr:hypothetical protein EDD86DRAFT_245554 [Gorgonomyces haynaldii]
MLSRYLVEYDPWTHVAVFTRLNSLLRLDNELVERDTRIMELEKMVSTDEIQSLREKLNKAVVYIKKLTTEQTKETNNEEMEQLKQENEMLRAQSQRLDEQDTIRDLKTRISELEQEQSEQFSNTQQTVHELQQKLELLESENSRLKSQQPSSQTEEIEELKRQLEETQELRRQAQETAALRKQLEDQSAQMTRLKQMASEKIKRLTATNESLQQEVKNIKRQGLVDSPEVHEDYMNQFLFLQQEREQAQQESEEIKERLKTLEQALDQKTAALNLAQQQLEQEKSSQSVNQRSFEESQQLIEQLQQQMEAYEQYVQQQSQQTEAERSQMQEELLKLQQQLSEAQNMADSQKDVTWQDPSLLEAQQALQAENEHLSRQIDSLQQNYQEQIDSLQHSHQQQMDSLNQTYQEQMDLLQKENTQHLERLKTRHQEELQTIKSTQSSDQHDEIHARYEEAQQQVIRLENELLEAREQQILSQQSLMEELKLEYMRQTSELEREKELLSEQLLDLKSKHQQEIQTLEEQLRQSLQNLKAVELHMVSLEQQNQEYEQYLEKAIQERKQAHSEHKVLQSQQETRLEALEAKIRQEFSLKMEEREQQYLAEKKQLESDLETVKSINEQLQQSFEPKPFDWTPVIQMLDSVLESQEPSCQIPALQASFDRLYKFVTELQSKTHPDQTQDLEQLQKQLDEYVQAYNQQLVLVQQFSDENQFLEQERQHLSSKLEHFKEVVGPKLKQEMEQNQTLTHQLQLLQQEKESLLAEMQDSAHLSNQQSDAQVADLQVQNKKLNDEVHRLRQFLMEIEENQTRDALGLENAIQEYKQQVQLLERARDDLQAVASQEQQARLEAETRYNECKQKLGEASAEVQNLKSKLLQEATKKRDIKDALEALESNLEETHHRANEWQSKAEELQLDELQIELPKRRSSVSELEEKEALIGKLRADALRKMRSGTGEEFVDRQLLSNLIVGFISAPRGTSKPFEILSVISSVLKFSDSEKAKVGLIRGVEQESPKSFMDMWISFLQKESAGDQTPKEQKGLVSRIFG